jgi:hypothetical protein
MFFHVLGKNNIVKEINHLEELTVDDSIILK